MAAIGSTPLERVDEAEGVLIVTAAADKGLVDIHDRRPLVLVPDAAREWMKQDVSGKEAEEIAADGAVSADHFIWHPVTRAVGNVKNQGPEAHRACWLMRCGRLIRVLKLMYAYISFKISRAS